TPKMPHDPPWSMLAGPLLLAILGLLFGLAPWLVGGSVIVPAASAVAGESLDYSLSLWHGFTPMLALSVITIVLGIFVLRRWDALRNRLAGMNAFERWGPDAFYDRLIAGLQTVARWQTDLIQTGSLRIYVGRTFAVLAIAALATIIFRC